MNQIDLFLGRNLGLWALQQVTIHSVNQIFTTDQEIAEYASSKKIPVFLENANKVSYHPSIIGFSIHYPLILKKEMISKYKKIYNLHPGYLPWGKGYYPIFWALWEQTPAGATLHEITEELDAGPIVAQIQVEYFSHDTGGSLFRRVREAEKMLFLEYLPKMLSGNDIPSFPQPKGGSKHYKKEFIELKRHAPFKKMTGEELLRLIRCFTFSGYKGLEVNLGNYQYEIRLELLSNS